MRSHSCSFVPFVATLFSLLALATWHLGVQSPPLGFSIRHVLRTLRSANAAGPRASSLAFQCLAAPAVVPLRVRGAGLSPPHAAQRARARRRRRDRLRTGRVAAREPRGMGGARV